MDMSIEVSFDRSISQYKTEQARSMQEFFGDILVHNFVAKLDLVSRSFSLD